MNCKLCSDSVKDFIFDGTCGECIKQLVYREVKARERYSMAQVLFPEECGVQQPAEDSREEVAANEL